MQQHLLKKWVEARRFSNRQKSFGNLEIPSKEGSIWFHAASVGELEALWPVIRLAAERGERLVVTIFSASAEKSLSKLIDELKRDFGDSRRTQGAQASLNEWLSYGYSPWEGEWESALVRHKPALFVSHKYEAWPDLWVSLAALEIPLVVIGASLRGALKTARLFCLLFLGRLPELLFMPFDQSQLSVLQNYFPSSQISQVGDPRWERVLTRKRTPSERASLLVRKFGKNGRIRGLIGSAWLGDLVFLESCLPDLKGPVWIVPHKIDEQTLTKMMELLKLRGIHPQRTSKILLTSGDQLVAEPSQVGPQFLLVDELGILAELYAFADWVYVGGGFGEGVHSTIEPAVFGAPIAVGPKGTQKFYEITELKELGQLRVLENQSDLSEWVRDLHTEEDVAQRSAWRNFALSHSDASQKIWAVLEKFKLSC